MGLTYDDYDRQFWSTIEEDIFKVNKFYSSLVADLTVSLASLGSDAGSYVHRLTIDG